MFPNLRRNLVLGIVNPTKQYSNNKLLLKYPMFALIFHFFILFRALGILSDKKIIEYCLLDIEKYEEFVDFFSTFCS